MKPRAFTLLETLAVIAISVILAAVAFSAFQAVKSSSKAASCASNLHQIGLGLTLYCHDNDERYPPYVFQGTGKLTPQPKAFKAALETYKVPGSLFYCPLDPYAHTDYLSEFYTHVDTSYYMSIDYYNHGKVDGDGFFFSPTNVGDLTKVNILDDMSDLITDTHGKRSRSGPHGTRYNVLRADASVVNLPIVQP